MFVNIVRVCILTFLPLFFDAYTLLGCQLVKSISSFLLHVRVPCQFICIKLKGAICISFIVTGENGDILVKKVGDNQKFLEVNKH